MVGWHRVEGKRTVVYPDIVCRIFKFKLVSQSVPSLLLEYFAHLSSKLSMTVKDTVSMLSSGYIC